MRSRRDGSLIVTRDYSYFFEEEYNGHRSRQTLGESNKTKKRVKKRQRMDEGSSVCVFELTKNNPLWHQWSPTLIKSSNNVVPTHKHGL